MAEATNGSQATEDSRGPISEIDRWPISDMDRTPVREDRWPLDVNWSPVSERFENLSKLSTGNAKCSVVNDTDMVWWSSQKSQVLSAPRLIQIGWRPAVPFSKFVAFVADGSWDVHTLLSCRVNDNFSNRKNGAKNHTAGCVGGDGWLYGCFFRLFEQPVYPDQNAVVIGRKSAFQIFQLRQTCGVLIGLLTAGQRLRWAFRFGHVEFFPIWPKLLFIEFFRVN